MYLCRSRTLAGRLQGVLMLTQCIPSRPCVGPAGAPQVCFFCTDNNLLQEPRRRFHIQHCVSDSPARLMSHRRGLHPRRCVSPTVKAKGELSTTSKSPVSGAYPVANLLHLYYPCGVTAASPISELELSRAAAWAGEVAEKPLLDAVGRGWEGGTSDQMLIPEACLKVISQKEGEKRTWFVSSFFFFWNVSWYIMFRVTRISYCVLLHPL